MNPDKEYSEKWRDIPKVSGFKKIFSEVRHTWKPCQKFIKIRSQAKIKI